MLLFCAISVSHIFRSIYLLHNFVSGWGVIFDKPWLFLVPFIVVVDTHDSSDALDLQQDVMFAFSRFINLM